MSYKVNLESYSEGDFPLDYPSNILTRGKIVPGKYALIPPLGRTSSSVPGFEECNITIVASPHYGAGFVEYLAEVPSGAKTTRRFGNGEGVESFVFSLSGNGEVEIGGRSELVEERGYAYSPASESIQLENNSGEPWQLLLHKQLYQPLEGYSARTVFGNLDDVEIEPLMGVKEVQEGDLLPVELGFDVNFHNMVYEPGAPVPYAANHLEEHGMFFLSGGGLYLIEGEWIHVKKGDFLWFGPYAIESYINGPEKTEYLISKGPTNRDISLKK